MVLDQPDYAEAMGEPVVHLVLTVADQAALEWGAGSVLSRLEVVADWDSEPD